MNNNFKKAALLVVEHNDYGCMASMVRRASHVVTALEELLQEIARGCLPNSNGVCQEVARRVDERTVEERYTDSFELCSLMCEAVTLFPKFSGNHAYPVRCPHDERLQDWEEVEHWLDDGIWDEKEWADAAFWRHTRNTTDQWVGGYGAARIRYAEWLLGVWREVEVIINNTKEVQDAKVFQDVS